MIDILKSLLLSFVAVAVLLPVLRFALRRLSPAGHQAPLSPDEVRYMQKKEWQLTIAYFVFASVLSVFFSGALAMLSSILHISSEQMFVMTPNFKAFFAPGLLLGLTVALLPLRLSQSTLLNQDHDLYKQYLRQQEGLRSIRLYGILFGAMLVFSLVVLWFAMRWHVNVNENQVQVTNLLNQERNYPHSAIESIHYLGAEGEYLITFEDQTILNTSYLKPISLDMIALISDRSGKRVIR
ncbi:hypothetical protein [Pontibacter virosus]|uniref:Uncharacterized protein n=1 Tax=Pontibacter virosus TaxID=1765052 RepID=A0A2U1AVR4_9BACT|nr:hypothetical protein [Pontibacter virosus]PVY40451.1 hypothetical protein C8E01_10782 [Pontibacter virosus]